MIVTCVHIKVKPEHIQEFIAATLLNHQGSVNEPGNVRFDVHQDAGDPTKFLLYEVFEDEAAVAAHKETAHYFAWRDTVENWMAEPRKGIRYNLIAPQSPDLW
ncbi:MAG: antibiotic biosynthesis monooxygenase [Bacteroidia bacterium]